MATATLGGVPIPRITRRSGDFAFIGSRERAVDGTLHVDYVAEKRTWSIDCSYLTLEQFRALEQVRRQARGGAVLLTLPDADEHYYVVITSMPDEVTAFGPGDGSWERSGRSVTMELEEA